MGKTLKIICLVPIIGLILFILAFFIVPVLNNIRLNSFANQLDNYSTPEKTIVISKHQTIGKLNGNGNGIDYFACILVKSELSLDEVKKYYENMPLKNARKSGKNSVIIDVNNIKSEILDTTFLERENIIFDRLIDVEDYTGYFVVIIYDGGYPAGFDIRGN